MTTEQPAPADSRHDTLKYSLLGPSLTKSGQDSVDQKKVSEIIYNASKGSKYFNNEEKRDQNLTEKIDKTLKKKAQLEQLDLSHERRKADDYIAELELSRDLSQTIVHIDCDAFYAACEELDRPELKEVPFAVGKGVLTTCNYHARKFGCRSGMAGFVAKKLCPQLIQLPLNFEKYTAKAQEVREIIVDYDARFESASIDEAYLNITAYCEKHQMTPEDVVQQLRREVHEKTNITISAGIAANAKLAKICSNINKPNGQFLLASDRATIMAFMRDLPTRKVNGIGRVFERELDAIGIKTLGDIPPHAPLLPPLFGQKATQFLLTSYLGLGRTKIQPASEYERKSVGTESTFNDISDPAELRKKLYETAEELEKDLLRTGFKGRTLVLKVKLSTYEVLTRQVVMGKAVGGKEELGRWGVGLLGKLEEEVGGMMLRLMGLRCTNLVSINKPDTLTFLGFKKKSTKDESPESGTLKRKASSLSDTDIDPHFPDTEFETQARLERQAEMDEIEYLSQEPDFTPNSPNSLTNQNEKETVDPRRFHGKVILPNPKPKEEKGEDGEEGEEEYYTCPICLLPQSKVEREFNEHIDSCLSWKTIREVQRGERDSTTDNGGGVRNGIGTGTGKEVGKRGKKVKVKGKVEEKGDPRQRKLFFG